MKRSNEEKRQMIMGAGAAVGAGGGVALGLVMMQVLDKPGFFALGIAIGVTIGTVIAIAVAEDEEA